MPRPVFTAFERRALSETGGGWSGAGEASVTIYSVAGQAISFRSLGPGDTFGEYAAIYGEPRAASVEARSSCVIASMSAKEFRKLFVTQAVLKGLVRNIQSLTKRVYEFSTLAQHITAIGESPARGQERAAHTGAYP